MAQHPKAEVRHAILRAAAEAFAEAGFERASLADIVRRAGTSIGNLYKYFANKEELFAEFLPREFTADLTRRLRAQVEAARGQTDLFALDADHPYRQASDDLLRFTIEHRERIVFLLLRAEGTRHERFASGLERLLVDLAQEHARLTYPAFADTPASRRALARIYKAFVATMGTILSEERSERALRAAVAMHSTYHLSGLKALFLEAQRGVTAEGDLT